MIDRVFGKVEYDYGWCKPETIDLLGMTHEITCVASAYKNETISREQREKYAEFKERKNDILKQVDEVIKCHVQNHHAEYVNRLEDTLVPKELIFHQDGAAGILFECAWDVETGIVVGIFPKMEIVNPDNFL